MRNALLASIPCIFLALGSACSGSASEGSASDSSTGTGTDSDSSTGESATTTATATASGSNSNSNSGTGGACTPGMSIACACPDGGMGAQVCEADGNSYAPCECTGSTASTTDGPTTDGPTTDGPTTDGPTTDGPTTTDTTTTTDGPTTDGPTTTTTDGPECVDPDEEPNDSPNESVDLGEQSCNAMTSSFQGVLNGDTDRDWFSYAGQWGQGCGFGDADTVTTVTADEDIQICVFAECDQGQTNLDCPNNTDPETVQGVDGCCGTGEIQLTVECQGTQNRSAQMWIRLDQAPEGSCVEYSVDYDYND